MKVFTCEEVAEMLYHLCGDDPAPCNHNDNDEWLSYLCPLADQCSCFDRDDTNKLLCWQQYVLYIDKKDNILNQLNYDKTTGDET